MQASRLGTFLETEFPPRDCLLDPWLVRQGLAMVYAPRGIGKTFFSLGVAYAAATEGKFLDWQATRRSRVVYIDGEMPAVTMQERLASMVSADPRTDAEIGDPELRIVSQELQEPSMPDLASIEGQALFDQVTTDADLIVVDNISTLCRAGAENKADDWNLVSEWALRMRREGRTVLFVHHAGKGGQQRGTSKREDILDVVIALRRPVEENHEGAAFELHFEKARHLFGDEVKPFVASLSDGCWKVEQIEDNTYRRVIALTREEYTPSEIALEIDRHKSQVSRHLKRARAAGDLPAEEASEPRRKGKQTSAADYRARSGA